MAELSDTHPTLADLAKISAPDGSILKVIEILNRDDMILDDIVWIEANDGTGHIYANDLALPAPTWRMINAGVAPTKGATVQMRDACGMLADLSEVDVKLVQFARDQAAARFQFDRKHIEGMRQEFSSSLFYASTTTAPEEILGLAPRYADQTGTNGEQILTSAATPDNSDNASIWGIAWDPMGVHGIYPRGTMAGLDSKDYGVEMVEVLDASGTPRGRAPMYRTWFEWNCGIAVEDWRYAWRIQYDQEDLVADAATGPNLLDLIAEAIELWPTEAGGARRGIYCNRKAMQYLRLQSKYAIASSTLSSEMVAGKHVTMIDGIPVRRCDALTNAEAAVTT